MTGRILIVDDVATRRIVLKVRLAAASYDVVQAADIAAARAVLAAGAAALVILSSRLPGLAQFCAELRRGPGGAGRGILVLGSGLAVAERLSLLAAGADDVLPAQLADGALMALVRSLLRRRAAAPAPGPGLAEAPAGFDRPGRVVLVCDDACARDRLAAELGRWRLTVAAMASDRVFPSLRTGPAPDAFVLTCPDGSLQELRLLAELRARPASANCPVVVLGALADPEFRIMALDLGAADVLALDCDRQELALRLQARIGQKRDADRRRAAVERELRLAKTDPLTGIANRRAAMEQLAAMAAEAAAPGEGYALMVLDIDRFKLVNDRFGHPAGDRVLAEVARRLPASLREGDLVARIGGEEFLVALPMAALVPARRAAERLRRAIEVEPVRLPGGETVRVTVSIGLTLAGPGDDDVEAAMARADRALYAAKAQGRNTVTVQRSVA